LLKNVVTVLFVAVGLLNLYPVVGAISAEQLTNLYGIGITSPDLETLMRHRAVMLGLIGGFLLVAAFRPALRVPAAFVGLVSMMSFVILAFMSGDIGPGVRRVAIADIAGSVIVILAWLLAARVSRRTTPSG
jgi:hypothetical protein